MSETIRITMTYGQRVIIHGRSCCDRCKRYAPSGNDLHEVDGYWLCARCTERKD